MRSQSSLAPAPTIDVSPLPAQTILSRSESLCLLVNEKNTAAQLFYKRAGYKLRSVYDTIFLA